MAARSTIPATSPHTLPVRENGGQYTHAATWLAWAHARLGDGAGAAHLFGLLNPVLRTATAAEVGRYAVEPYVIPADVYGVPPLTGRGGWTWYTGAAAWMWRLGIEAILGLYREAGGVRFEPCIPPEWPGFEATLHVQGRTVHVRVENPGRVGRGIASITLDGRELASALLKFDSEGRSRHEVRIVLDAGASGAAAKDNRGQQARVPVERPADHR
ncbi:MAG TPA: glycosyl hydrolase family 65 protein [Polyangiaceae bacterium]|nr:glycosyl hydrolase family 65 protein [Polyangiaceae bacterium]